MASRTEILNSALDQLINNNASDISGAAIVGNDGLLLSSRLSGDTNVERVAAISATMMGVTARVAGELKIGAASEAIVHAEQGYFLIIPVTPQMMLSMTLRSQANLGMVRLEARETSRAIAAALNGAGL